MLIGPTLLLFIVYLSDYILIKRLDVKRSTSAALSRQVFIATFEETTAPREPIMSWSLDGDTWLGWYVWASRNWSFNNEIVVASSNTRAITRDVTRDYNCRIPSHSVAATDSPPGGNICLLVMSGYAPVVSSVATFRASTGLFCSS